MLTAVAIFLFLCALFWGTIAVYAAKSPRRRWPIVTSHVTGTAEKDGWEIKIKTGYSRQVSYTVNNKSFTKTLSETYSSISWRIGDKVKLRVNPAAPSDAWQQGLVMDNVDILFWIISVLCLMASIITFLMLVS